MPAAPGIPTKSAPTCPTSAQMCSALQPPADTAARWATAATESRNATNTTSRDARTNRPPFVASLSRGTVDNTKPPSAGSVAMAWHGIVMSRASGAPDTSGAVMSETMPSGPGA